MPDSTSPSTLRDRTWRRFLQAHDGGLVEELYNPALSAAQGYDRCCAYFSSSVLAVAARGFGAVVQNFLSNPPPAGTAPLRLLVNEEMSRDDVQALTEAGDLSGLESALLARLQSPEEAIEKSRLALLGWLVKQGWLEVRVGVLKSGGGVLHSKFGVIRDAAGDAIMFRGSANESASGLKHNVEHVEVTTSWEDPDGYSHFTRLFQRMWRNEHPPIATYSLPEAVRLKLLSFAPDDMPEIDGMKEGQPPPPPIKSPDPTERRRVAMLWHYLVEAPYLPNGETACDATALVGMWPHQRRVVEETATAWPEGRLLCDEVGMGKTIEAILILRRLLAGRGVRRVLILLPAGLLRQWQTELREKGGLIVPRLQGTTSLVWPDERTQEIDGIAVALRQPLLIASREMARLAGNLGLLLAAEPWDLVLLDESHAARRSEQKEGAFNQANLLLSLLRQLQLRQQAKSILLLSATPMQTQPWEPWDLLGVLGEGGAWLAEFKAVRLYYEAISSLQTGAWEPNTALATADVLLADPRVTHLPDGQPIPSDRGILARKLQFAPHAQRPAFISWLRKASPIARRIHRNTRDTLREYHRLGILPQAPAHRRVEDLTYTYQTPGEREIYDALQHYIERRFSELEGERPGKGFVMTIYRRRMASSPHAITQSLKRRMEGLQRVMSRFALSGESWEELPEGESGYDIIHEDDMEPISAAYPTDPVQAAQERGDVKRLLERLANLYGQDTKRDRFFSLLQSIIQDGRSALIFTEYADTMEYLRNFLVDRYQNTLATYSGEGGRIFEENAWHAVTKDTITRRLREGKIRIMICTDAASEGLNLQAAGAVINYDLPWNPSKVEQRIGRVDRIGQTLTEIRVINWFLDESVDQRVYQVLRERCGMFENFIGRMQPVLARAQKMLMGREPADTQLLADLARNQDADIFARETFDQETVLPAAAPVPIVDLACIKRAFLAVRNVLPERCVTMDGPDLLGIAGLESGGFQIGFSQETLEANPQAMPPTLTQPVFRHLHTDLGKGTECLPLIVAAASHGAFRTARAIWLQPDGSRSEVDSFQHLESLLAGWDGALPAEALAIETAKDLRQQAMGASQLFSTAADDLRLRMLSSQTSAARHRLMLELARYLACLEQGTGDLNGIFYQQMTRDTVSHNKLSRCFHRFEGCYPDWPACILWDATVVNSELPPNRRQARLIGSELEAAQADPRWICQIREHAAGRNPENAPPE